MSMSVHEAGRLKECKEVASRPTEAPLPTSAAVEAASKQAPQMQRGSRKAQL